MTLSRRSLLTGLLSTAAAIAAGPVAKVIPSAGNGLALWQARMDQEMLEFLHGMSQRIAHTVYYGNPDWEPQQFTGLAPFYHTGNVLEGGVDDDRALDWKIRWGEEPTAHWKLIA